MQTLQKLASKTYSIAAVGGWLSIFCTGLFVGWLVAMMQIPAECFPDLPVQEKIAK